MTLPVMGVADGYGLDDAIPPGVGLGIALQLVNVLRDGGEDAKRGRLYLPLDAVHAAGLTAEEILSGAVVNAVDGSVDARYATLIEGEIQARSFSSHRSPYDRVGVVNADP